MFSDQIRSSSSIVIVSLISDLAWRFTRLIDCTTLHIIFLNNWNLNIEFTNKHHILIFWLSNRMQRPSRVDNYFINGVRDPKCEEWGFERHVYGYFGWLEAKWFAGEREVSSSTINRVVVEKWSEEGQRGTERSWRSFSAASAHIALELDHHVSMRLSARIRTRWARGRRPFPARAQEREPAADVRGGGAQFTYEAQSALEERIVAERRGPTSRMSSVRPALLFVLLPFSYTAPRLFCALPQVRVAVIEEVEVRHHLLVYSTRTRGHNTFSVIYCIPKVSLRVLNSTVTRYRRKIMNY